MTVRQRGFTLIETVIAFAIASLSLATIYQTFGLTMRREHRVDDESLAQLHLVSLHDRLGVDLALRIGVTEGRIDDQFRWRIDARVSADARENPLATPLLEVTASVLWDRDHMPHAVSLQSLELPPLEIP